MSMEVISHSGQRLAYYRSLPMAFLSASEIGKQEKGQISLVDEPAVRESITGYGRDKPRVLYSYETHSHPCSSLVSLGTHLATITTTTESLRCNLGFCSPPPPLPPPSLFWQADSGYEAAQQSAPVRYQLTVAVVICAGLNATVRDIWVVTAPSIVCHTST